MVHESRMPGPYPDRDLVDVEETRRFSWSIADSIAEAKRLEIEEWRPQKEEWLVVVSIFVLYLMVALDATIVVPVLPVGCRRLSKTAIGCI